MEPQPSSFIERFHDVRAAPDAAIDEDLNPLDDNRARPRRSDPRQVISLDH